VQQAVILVRPDSLVLRADKPRGYAFIEYEHKKDMKEAYKQSDGRKIEGRRILVDVERGRTVENW
jgi:U1 small nuclear ribonucleoprotein